MLVTKGKFVGSPCLLICDAQCDKAWGINSRPRVELDENNPDDYCFLPDNELDTAPIDPGTSEGFDSKPTTPEQQHNKWCWRECERSKIKDDDTPDFSVRVYNISRG